MEKENIRLESNINPRNRMGRPVKSIKTRYAELMPKNDTRLGFLKYGDLVSGLTGAVQGYLGFSGAKQDALNEMAYYDYLAKLAEQERQDKLAQQAWEQEYKDKSLSQDLEKAKLAIDADKAKAALLREQALQDAAVKRAQTIEDREAQYAHEKEVYDLKRANELADRKAQLQSALDAEQRKQAYEQEQMAIKQLDPASQQKYYLMKQEGQTPEIIDNKVGWVGKIFGRPKYRLSVADAVKKGKWYSDTEADIMSKGLK